jgi:uncharacterized protein YlzI (FlbEa/FlbD family)
MIRLIRTDGQEILLNANLVQNVNEIQRGNTIITIVGGEEVTVKNTALDITQKMSAYRVGLAEAKKQEGKEKDKEKRKTHHEKKKGS